MSATGSSESQSATSTSAVAFLSGLLSTRRAMAWAAAGSVDEPAKPSRMVIVPPTRSDKRITGCGGSPDTSSFSAAPVEGIVFHDASSFRSRVA